MQIVFASSEVAPLAKTGGLGDVCGALPKALAARGHDVTIFMPYYRQAREWLSANGVGAERVTAMNLAWGNWSGSAEIMRTTLPSTDIPLYLIANDALFGRSQIYANRDDGHDDHLERYTFFCRAVVATTEHLRLRPDVLHAHDWHTALLPLYLDAGAHSATSFTDTASVFTIHNLNYQGRYGADRFPVLGLPVRYWSEDVLEYYGDAVLMKGGILSADAVTTVSPGYAREIQTPAYGAGLDGLLRSVSPNLTGILNGIDTDVWSPDSDPFLPSHYDAAVLAGKTFCKRALVKEASLRFRAKTPLIGVVSRLVEQKGFDLLLAIGDRLLARDVQLVVLGSGEAHLEEGFLALAQRSPDKCRVWTHFDEGLAHRITAGSDMLLMPSRYEPCGLNQMYALRYGTLPVVRMTGGLADTVIAYDGTNEELANGFGFGAISSDELFFATWVGLLTFERRMIWRKLQANGMAADFSWDASAARYEEVYRLAAERRRSR